MRALTPWTGLTNLRKDIALSLQDNVLAVKVGGTRMVLEVRLLSDAWLWRWEIRMAGGGEPIVSSWEATWTAYPTYEQALAAGQRRLAELRGRGGAYSGECACAA